MPYLSIETPTLAEIVSSIQLYKIGATGISSYTSIRVPKKSAVARRIVRAPTKILCKGRSSLKRQPFVADGAIQLRRIESVGRIEPLEHGVIPVCSGISVINDSQVISNILGNLSTIATINVRLSLCTRKPVT